MKDEDSATNTLDGVTLVPKPSRRLLNERQLIDYRAERERCIDTVVRDSLPERDRVPQADGWKPSTLWLVKTQISKPLTPKYVSWSRK